MNTNTDTAAGIPSIMGLHLRYRLWIAEMNSDINVLRIFEDSIKELEEKDNEHEVKHAIGQLHKQFVDIRTEIDELRHEMHLVKMKLGAYSREAKTLEPKAYIDDNHAAMNAQYENFRGNFNKIRKEVEELMQ